MYARIRIQKCCSPTELHYGPKLIYWRPESILPKSSTTGGIPIQPAQFLLPPKAFWEGYKRTRANRAQLLHHFAPLQIKQFSPLDRLIFSSIMHTNSYIKRTYNQVCFLLNRITLINWKHSFSFLFSYWMSLGRTENTLKLTSTGKCCVFRSFGGSDEAKRQRDSDENQYIILVENPHQHHI